MVDSGTFLDVLAANILRAGQFNKNDQCPPAAILWPDKERQWEPLLPALAERLPLLTLGLHAPDRRTGPAVWLRCMVARTLPDDRLPDDVVPILYLPGVSRAELREVEECPKSLQPLVELQYRGVLWTHKNGRDWTIGGFLQSADGGLGVALAGDAATKEALGRALLKVAYEPVARLRKEAPLRAAFFNELLNPDQTRRLLLWLNDPQGYPKQVTPSEWYAFCEICQNKYGFHPVDDGPLVAAGLLGGHPGAWAIIWDRYNENPESYAGLPDLLRRARPPQSSFFDAPQPYWPQDTEAAEAEVQAALLALKDAMPIAARAAVARLEADHGPRRDWVWAKLGQAPLAQALQPLAALAKASEKALGGATVTSVAAAFVEWGWQVDAAVLEALAAVEKAEDVAAVNAVIQALYRPWLEKAALALQAAVVGNPAQNYAPSPAVIAEAGTCTLFSDALRFDAGRKLAQALERRGLQCSVGWRLAALPTVTPTAKPAVSPAAGLLAAGPTPGLTPVVAESGSNLTAGVLRTLLKDAGIQVLGAEELGDPAGSAWTEMGAIDSYGHDHGYKLAHHVAAELRTLERRAEDLLKHGWQQVLVVTDHGWLLLPGGLPKVELPEHLTVLRKGRCAVLKQGAVTDQHTVPWHWSKDVRIAVASGIGCYEAGREYEHGGISPQECIVPILTVSKPISAAAQELVIASAVWTGLRCNVTVDGASVGMAVDIRTKAGSAATSLAAAKSIVAGKASLVVEDDDQLGAAAFVVVLDADGAPLVHVQTTIGG